MAPPNRRQIALDQEVDGRWLSEVPSLPGGMAYGSTPDVAMANAKALVLRVMADRLEHGEEIPKLAELFSVAA